MKKFGVILLVICIVLGSMTGCVSQMEVNKENNTVVTEDKKFIDGNIGETISEITDKTTEKIREEIEKELEKENVPEPDVNEEAPSQDNSEENTSSTKPGNTVTTDKPQPSPYLYCIKVNRLANCVTIYTKDENGAYTIPVKAMICSVGKNINSTPTGVFRTSDKYEWRYLFGNQYGQYATRITGHILFHSVPYIQQEKDTLNTNYYNNLGIGDSMGCIRLTCEDAKWIYDNCASGTTVEIYDSEDPGPLGKPTAIKIDVNSPYAGWDPTDPDPSNPWKNQESTSSDVKADNIAELDKK